MPKHIAAEVVDELVGLGERGLPGIPRLLSIPDVAGGLLMRGVQAWYFVAVRLDQQRLRNLIKGLVLYSQESGWRAGSVSPVIQLYKAFADRFPEDEPELNRWIIANRRNQYEPFGSTMFDDAPTLREHQRLWAQHRHDRSLARQRQEEARLTRIAAAATAKLPNAVRRGDLSAVKALIAKGGDWRQPDESGTPLLKIAEAAGRTDMVSFLQSLEHDERSQLNVPSPGGRNYD